jgi:hypothetical protein
LLKWPIYRHGLVVVAGWGPRTDGRWGSGDVTWSFVEVAQPDDSTVRLETREDCKWFPGLRSD